MIKNNLYLFLCTTILLFSCEKKDHPITLPPKGAGVAMQVNMGDKYTNQFFVSLENQQVVATGLCDEWDLSFSTSDSNHSVHLNGGQGMAAYATNKTNFADVNEKDTTNINDHWLYDEWSGISDSTALKDALSSGQVYLIRLNASDKNFKKLKITYADAYEYRLELGDLTTTTPQTKTIIKNNEYNFIYFSLHSFKEISGVEPFKNNWDIHFTTYNHTFYDQNPPLRYVVTGCLLNPNNTWAYKDSVWGYNNISREAINAIQLSQRWDALGYDWKKIDWASGSTNYVIDPRYSYIIRTQNNRYYKLRFIGFYSPTGEKGSPKFEFVEL